MGDIESGDYAINPMITEVVLNHADIYKKNDNKDILPLGINKITEVINTIYYYIVETYNDMIS
jgi:hypothetical protein